MKNCVIVGGGIIGLCTAYYLAREGHQVTVLDKAVANEGCSYGNAGMIVPSHVIPLAQPGMIAQGVRWMFDSKSPFYVKPRFSSSLLKWGWEFYKHANEKHVNKAMPALKELSLLSKSLYQELSEIDNSYNYEEKGLLMLYKTAKMEAEMIHEGEVAQKLGLTVDFLDKAGVSNLETGVKTEVIGGVHFKSDAHLYPQRFIQFLKKELEKLQVTICYETTAKDFEINNGKVTGVITEASVYNADEIILACGAWSPEIAKKIKHEISVLPGKGYSFTINNPSTRPTIPSILCEGKVAVTPMGNDIRFGGTLEITHTNDKAINMNRVKGITDTITQFYPEWSFNKPNKEDIWFGFRPCTPTGLPIIKKLAAYKNITVATGHAMMGLSLAPATGLLVAQLINNKPTSVNLELYQ